MRLAVQDGPHHFRGGRAHGFAPSGSAAKASTPGAPDGSWACVRERVVCRYATELRAWEATRLPCMEDLDGGRGVARFQLLADQLIRNAVIMPVDLDVIIDVGADRFPLRQDVAFRRQRLQGRTIQFSEQAGPAGLRVCGMAGVESIQQGAMASFRSASAKNRR